MRVLIADDHKIFLDGLELLLSTFGFVTTVCQACSREELSALLAREPVDIVLLDIAFGKADGREICKDLKKTHPHLKLIALTSHGDMATVKSAVSAGFDGYLLKSESRDTILQALQLVAEGEQFFSPQVKDVFFRQGVAHHKAALTKRELEILQLIVDEKTIKEIAEALFVSEKTVENHRANLMLKLDARNMAGLVKKALTLGYL